MRILQLVAVALLLPGFPASIQAAMVHKWIDDAGVTHYSDEPPPAGATGLERIELPPPPPRAASEIRDHYHSIANQWRRLHRERIELERLRLERGRDDARRERDPIVVPLPVTRHSVTLLPRLVPRLPRSQSRVAAPEKRHPLAIPGRDWPVGLHPGRLNLRGGIESP